MCEGPKSKVRMQQVDITWYYTLCRSHCCSWCCGSVWNHGDATMSARTVLRRSAPFSNSMGVQQLVQEPCCTVLRGSHITLDLLHQIGLIQAFNIFKTLNSNIICYIVLSHTALVHTNPEIKRPLSEIIPVPQVRQRKTPQEWKTLSTMLKSEARKFQLRPALKFLWVYSTSTKSNKNARPWPCPFDSARN